MSRKHWFFDDEHYCTMNSIEMDSPSFNNTDKVKIVIDMVVHAPSSPQSFGFSD